MSTDLSISSDSAGGRRRLQRLAAAAAGVLAGPALLLATPAAANAASGVHGALAPAVCGWYTQGGTMFYDYRITAATLPWVTGTSKSAQLVWTHIEFKYANGAVYRQGWYYTYARAGVWTKTWTAYTGGAKGQTIVYDAPGESGYTNVANDTYVLLAVSWMTKGVVTGAASEWETAPNSTQNKHVCDGGSWVGSLAL